MFYGCLAVERPTSYPSMLLASTNTQVHSIITPSNITPCGFRYLLPNSEELRQAACGPMHEKSHPHSPIIQPEAAYWDLVSCSIFNFASTVLRIAVSSPPVTVIFPLRYFPNSKWVRVMLRGDFHHPALSCIRSRMIISQREHSTLSVQVYKYCEFIPHVAQILSSLSA